MLTIGLGLVYFLNVLDEDDIVIFAKMLMTGNTMVTFYSTIAIKKENKCQQSKSYKTKLILLV